jgi:hypothetical protein
MEAISFSPIFKALLNEADFTKQMLGSGVTQIGKAGYATKGVYFQSFTSLATGLERVGKLCLMLDYFLDHAAFPDMKYIKREIGHQISLIHQKLSDLVVRRAIKLDYLQELRDPIHVAIIEVLSDFAEGDRYSNIDLLVGSTGSNDPIAAWFKRVDMPLSELRVPAANKATILRNAQAMEQVLGSWSAVLHTSETGEMITNLGEASLRTGIFEAVAPYRQLYVLQVIRYWVEVLYALQWMVKDIEVPHFGEIFGAFYNNDSMFRGRKTWDRF